MSEPTTEAGKRLAERLDDLTDGMFPYARDIAAIEAEARDNQNNADLKAWKQRIQTAAVNAVLDRLAADIETMDDGIDSIVPLAAIRVAIEQERR